MFLLLKPFFSVNISFKLLFSFVILFDRTFIVVRAWTQCCYGTFSNNVVVSAKLSELVN